MRLSLDRRRAAKSDCLHLQIAGRGGVAGSLEWAGTGEGGGQGDGGEEERPELDAQVKKIFNLIFSASTKLTPEQRLWDVVGPLLCHHTSTQLFSIPCSVLFRKKLYFTGNAQFLQGTRHCLEIARLSISIVHQKKMWRIFPNQYFINIAIDILENLFIIAIFKEVSFNV